MTHYSPEDRPDPAEQPIRARVPEHISGGAFSTGVIVMTAQTEFILDFVQNLGRPHQIVARVVMPHNVLPQLVDALQRNIELYRSRWGDLPQTGSPNVAQVPWAGQPSPSGQPGASPLAGQPDQPSETQPGVQAGVADGAVPSNPPPTGASPAPPQLPPTSDAGQADTGIGGAQPPTPGTGARQTSAQEIYDDLKIRDELLSGAYANAVMIGHGPHEFSFDFITNFYPNSAVSSRVFLAAGQVPRLYDSLKGTWDQLRLRMQPPMRQNPAGPSATGTPPQDPTPQDQHPDDPSPGNPSPGDGTPPPQGPDAEGGPLA